MIHLLGIASKKEITEIRPLDDVEYQSVVTARTELSKFAKKHELFRLVYTNYMEYKTILNEYFMIYSKNADMAGSYLEKMVFNLNRIMLNFLSAFRTFLDHTQTNLDRIYGKESENFKIFKKIRSSCYDTYFSYRFLDKLRNYSQHVGMPITGIDTSSELVYINPKEVEHKLRATVLKSDLLEFKEWGNYTIYDKCGNPEKFKIKDEIDRLPDKIDINPYIDELIYCIEKINATLFGKKEFIELLKHTEFLDKLVKEASIREGTPCIIVQVQDTSKTEKFRLFVVLCGYPRNVFIKTNAVSN